MSSKLYQFQYSYERDLVTVYLSATIAAAGAPTMVNRKGVNAITRLSAGKYRIDLRDNANQLMSADMISVVSSGLPAAPDMAIAVDNINDPVAPSITVQLLSPAGAAIDPASGEKLLINIVARRAST